MDIDKLKTFLQVAQYGSFKQAANKEFLSQRAVSKQITQLETELGITLFWRRAKPNYINTAGEIFFLSSAQDMVNNYTKAIADLQTFNQQAHQTLKVGYFSAFEERLLRPALYTLKEQDADLYLSIREESNEHLVQSVRLGNLDAALSIRYGHSELNLEPSLTAVTIFHGEMVMGVSTLNPLSKRPYLVTSDLVTKPILYYSPETSTFLLESFLASMPFIADHERVRRVTSIEQMQIMVALDQAFAFYPAGLLDDSLLTTDSHIHLLPVHETNQQGYDILVIYPRKNENPALKKFLTLLGSSNNSTKA